MKADLWGKKQKWHFESGKTWKYREWWRAVKKTMTSLQLKASLLSRRSTPSSNLIPRRLGPFFLFFFLFLAHPFEWILLAWFSVKCNSAATNFSDEIVVYRIPCSSICRVDQANSSSACFFLGLCSVIEWKIWYFGSDSAVKSLFSPNKCITGMA